MKIELRKTPYIFTTVTIEGLKEDKEEIISLIKEHTQDVKAVMSEMIIQLSDTEITCTVDYTNDVLCKMGYFNGASERMAEINKQNGMAIMAAR